MTIALFSDIHAKDPEIKKLIQMVLVSNKEALQNIQAGKDHESKAPHQFYFISI